jgi:hypothetical protein
MQLIELSDEQREFIKPQMPQQLARNKAGLIIGGL